MPTSSRTLNGIPTNVDRPRHFTTTEDDPATTAAPAAAPCPVYVDKVAEVETPVATVAKVEAPVLVTKVPDDGARPALALFCFEDADTAVGQHVLKLANALWRKQFRVHLFTRTPFPPGEDAEIMLHAVGTGPETELIEQAQDFGHRAFNAFLRQFPPGTRGAAVGHEWTSAFALSMVQSIRNLPTVLAIQSLERQRSDMSGPLAARIEEIELGALRQPHRVLVHDPATAEVAKHWVPECRDRITNVRPIFPLSRPAAGFDAGAVKARYQIGPIDPTILYVGDFSEPYGPDVLMKSLPAVFKNNKQARAILVGDGSLYWTLRVYSRYLLLDHAVRMPGSVEGQAMVELMQAADVVVVPSREPTPWWPILAAWAAERPLVTSHNAAPSLVEHLKDGVLVYPNESSVTWGIERILFDPAFGKTIAAEGARKLEQKFGWNGQAEQILELAGLLADHPGA